MKILSVNAFSHLTPVGGAERTMLALLRALQSRGHDISVAGTMAEPGFTHDTENDLSIWHAGIRNIYWPRQEIKQPGWKRMIWHMLDIYNIGMRRQMEMLLDMERPDVMILHNLVGWSISAVDAARSRKIPTVQVLHDLYNVCPNVMMFRNGRNCDTQCRECRIMRAPHRAITSKVDAVVGVSQFILDRHLALGAYSRVPVKRVIRNVRSAATLGVDQAPALRAKAMAERDGVSIRFGFIGAVAAYKGVEHALEAFTRLDDPGAELWIAGKGNADYVAGLRQKFPSPRIRFLGQTPPREFFTAIDVTIVPSLWQENLPGVVSESFAFGVPVIGSRRGGIPEMGLDQGAGILFEPDQPGELEAAMRNCAENPHGMTQMSSRALAKGKEFLDSDGWALKYENLFEAIKQKKIARAH